LHAIDEPPTRTAARIHALPHVCAAQHTDRNEATRCWLWRCEAWLLADCWHFWTSTPQRHRPARLATGTCTCGAVLYADNYGSSVERAALSIANGRAPAGGHGPIGPWSSCRSSRPSRGRRHHRSGTSRTDGDNQACRPRDFAYLWVVEHGGAGSGSRPCETTACSAAVPLQG
jgi:hypothetical protein